MEKPADDKSIDDPKVSEMQSNPSSLANIYDKQYNNTQYEASSTAEYQSSSMLNSQNQLTNSMTKRS